MPDLYRPSPTLFQELCAYAGGAPIVRLRRPFEHWMVTDPVWAQRVLKDTAHFTSTRGTGLRDTPPAPGVSLNLSDPPTHGVLRRRVESWMRHRLEAVGTEIETLAGRLVGGAHLDFVSEVSDPLSWQSLCLVLGLEASIREDLRCLSLAVSAAQSRKELEAADLELLERLLHRPVCPDFGLSSADRAYLGRLLLVTGWLSTSNAISLGMYGLLQSEQPYPGPGQLGLAVEEFLRYSAPVSRIGRGCIKNTLVADVSVMAGDRVMIAFAPVNRCPRRFGRPDGFSLTPDRGRHLSFGCGPHRCLGADLARTEIRAVLRALQSRPRPQLKGSPQWRRSSFLMGYAYLPLVWPQP